MDLRLGRKHGRGAASPGPPVQASGLPQICSASQDSLANEWLADVVICYALRSNDIFRFVTTSDTERWQTDSGRSPGGRRDLCKLSWPTKMAGAGSGTGGA